MNSITKIENLASAFESEPSKKNTSPYDQELATLEHFIDKLVTVENNAAKADAKAAIQKARLLEEFERKIAFLTGQIHRAESELAALEGSNLQSPLTPGDNQLLDSRKHEVTYWKSRLRQLAESNEMNHSL